MSFVKGNTIGAETRFKIGRSGNPAGRPPDKLQRFINVKLGKIEREAKGKEAAATKPEALAEHIVGDAIGGCIPSRKKLVDHRYPALNRHELATADSEATGPTPGSGKRSCQRDGGEIARIRTGAFSGDHRRHGRRPPSVRVCYPTRMRELMRNVARLSLALLLGALACSEPASRKPNLILVSLDTLRADRLGAYGYDRPTSPSIDVLAARGVRFARAYSTAPWTLPAHMSLFTGLSPEKHATTRWARVLPEEIPTLAEVLRSQGYRTFGHTSGAFVSPTYGFGRGYEEYNQRLTGFQIELNNVRARIESLPPDDPYFIFIQTTSVHCPYAVLPHHEKAFRTQPRLKGENLPISCLVDPTEVNLSETEYRTMSDRYDASIRTADDHIGEFVDFLDARGELDDTYLVLFSDHGDEFGDHGSVFHGHSLYEEMLHVPLIMIGGDAAPGVVKERVSLIDFMPTILDLLGIDAPASEGRSLAELIRSPKARQDEDTERPLFSAADQLVRIRGVISGRHKLILDLKSGEVDMYDLEADPMERTDIAASEPEIRDRLRGLLDQQLQKSPRGKASKADLTPDHVEELRALGYVE